MVGCWRGYLSGDRGAGLHIAHLMPLPLTVSCFSEIQIGFTSLVPDHPGSPRQGPLDGCECEWAYCADCDPGLCLWLAYAEFIPQPGDGLKTASLYCCYYC